jgi:CRISPR-associated protein Cmr1
VKTLTHSLELITPCFCGGARPDVQTEIRAPSIRGQLRWWFRVLGGFKSLAAKPVPEQERVVFGDADPAKAVGSGLIVRVKAIEPRRLKSRVAKDADGMQAPAGSDRGYLLFPLRGTRRAVFDGPQLPRFDLEAVWRGDPILWEDIQALLAIYGHLGSIGFRARRAMGALAFQGNAPPLGPAFQRFDVAQRITVKSLAARNANEAVTVLARWLRGWRSYGRTQDLRRTPQRGPGFKWARNDHDAAHHRNIPETYRPALGLPIMQSFAAGGQPVCWDYNPANRGEPKGHFASPILLRPYRAVPNQWQALVIFVDARQWPAGKKVFIDGQPRAVSLALYEAMRNDPRLEPVEFLR